MTRIALLLFLALGACGVPTQNIIVEAINQERQSVRCRVIVGGEWTSPPLYTSQEIPLVFERRDVSILVKAIPEGQDNVEQHEQSRYLDGDPRLLRIGDPYRQLFILRDDPDWQGH